MESRLKYFKLVKSMTVMFLTKKLTFDFIFVK